MNRSGLQIASVIQEYRRTSQAGLAICHLTSEVLLSNDTCSHEKVAKKYADNDSSGSESMKQMRNLELKCKLRASKFRGEANPVQMYL